jgi:hypothetical protein
MAKGRGLAEQVARAAKSETVPPALIASVDQPAKPAKQSSRAGKKGLTVYFDPPTHRKLKYVAFKRECSIEAVIRSAVAKELEGEEVPD